MNQHDGESDPEPALSDPSPAPKKRLVTPEMMVANARNAQLSTGPRTEAGRRKSSLNSTTLGLTCTKLIFLPGESIEQFEADVVHWSRQLGATTEPEIAQVQTALYQQLKAERADRAEVCAVSEAVNKINDSFDDRQQEAVLVLIPELATKPKETHRKLMSTSAGIAWLIREFTYFKRHLTNYSSFHYSEKAHALRIGGHDPKDLFTDPMVWGVTRAYFGGVTGPGGFTAEAVAGSLQEDCPDGITDLELRTRLQFMVNDLPTIDDAQHFLRRYVQDWIDKLTERLELVGLRETRDRAIAVGKSALDTSAEGDKRKRHGNASTRLSQSAIRLLLSIKNDRRKDGDGDQDDLSSSHESVTEPGSAETVAPQPAASEPEHLAPPTVANGSEASESPAAEDRNQNEPVPAQVVFRIDDSEAIPARPAVPVAASAPDTIAAAVADVGKPIRGFDDRCGHDPFGDRRIVNPPCDRSHPS